jgi:hypothetical protein
MIELDGRLDVVIAQPEAEQLLLLWWPALLSFSPLVLDERRRIRVYSIVHRVAILIY